MGRCGATVGSSFITGALLDGNVATVEIQDPDVHRKDAPVDERGRVSVGRELAGENVTVVVERQEEPDNE